MEETKALCKTGLSYLASAQLLCFIVPGFHELTTFAGMKGLLKYYILLYSKRRISVFIV